MSSHIYAPPYQIIRKVRFCPTEKRRRRMIIHTYEWYGPTLICCGCGDRWNEDGRMSRPFERGWRERASRIARQEWIRT